MTPAPQTDDDFCLDPELHAYIDGKLPPDRVAIIEARLAGDAEARTAVQGWGEARALIRAAAQAADDAPADMRTELLARELSARVRRARVRNALTGPGLRRLAASVMIFAAGWAGHSFYMGSNASALPTHEAMFLEMAAVQPDREAETADASANLILETLQRLSGEGSYRYPSFEDHGLTLTGTALSEGQDGPAVRLYYETDTGKRISVMVMRHPESEPDYPYQVRALEGQVLAYMTRGGLDYAISGEEDPVVLARLASALP